MIWAYLMTAGLMWFAFRRYRDDADHQLRRKRDAWMRKWRDDHDL